MNLANLQIIWFVLITVLWVGYLVLEGFDFGVGMLLTTIGKTDAERRAIITTLGPLWDGNEVWVLVAGGATFAAFPHWYATLFSGFYLPLLLILVGLIVRGVAFEYRSKKGDASWRARWDLAIVVSSAVPAVLWGVAFGNIVRGVPLTVDATSGYIEYTGGFFNLLNPYALLGGITTATVFATHGAIFLALKTDGTVRARANALVLKLGLVAAVAAVAFLLWSQFAYSGKTWTLITVLLTAVAWVVALLLSRMGREGLAFLFSAVTIALTTVSLFGMLYPNVLPNIDRALPGLTVTSASSTEYTLRIMTIVAVVFTPIVLAYQAWTYWVFRKRLSAEQIPNPDQGSLEHSMV